MQKYTWIVTDCYRIENYMLKDLLQLNIKFGSKVRVRFQNFSTLYVYALAC